jgi:hypothetical protein
VSDLPKWFDIDKYKKASTLDSAGWQKQLSIRLDCFGLTEPPVQDGPSRPADLAPAGGRFAQALSAIRENPIVDVASSQLLQAFFFQTVVTETTTTRRPPEHRLVKTMTVRQLRGLHASVDPSIWGIKPVPTVTTDKSELKAVIVNLVASDSVLKKGFAQWLKEVRAHEGSPKNVVRDHSANFRDWCDLGVLPYLDLTIWARQIQKTIPRPLFAKALFPDGKGDADTIKKRTEPIALGFMGQKTVGRRRFLGAL